MDIRRGMPVQVYQSSVMNAIILLILILLLLDCMLSYYVNCIFAEPSQVRAIPWGSVSNK